MINNVNFKAQQPPKKQQTVAAPKPEVYNNMKQWQESHENNMQAAVNLISNGYDEETVIDIFFEKSDELGETFDFMEGKDPNNENEYNPFWYLKTALKKIMQLLFHKHYSK